MSTQPASPGFRFNPRVAGTLAALLVFICGAVIVTDHVSPRKRTLDEPAGTTVPSATPASTPGTASATTGHL